MGLAARSSLAPKPTFFSENARNRHRANIQGFESEQ